MNDVIYQTVPYEVELGTGVWTYTRLDRLDLDGKRIDSTGSFGGWWLHLERDAATTYTFNGENPQRPTSWQKIDPATARIAEEQFENYTAPPMRGACLPPVWLETGAAREGHLVLGGHCQRQFLSRDPEHCWYTATPPTKLQPDWACVPATEWPIPDAARGTTTTFAVPERFAGVLWTEGTGAAARTRAGTIYSTSQVTAVAASDVGPGQPLFVRNDEQYGSRAFGGVDHPRWADLLAMSEETADGGRKTTIYRVNGSRRFVPTAMPTRACADGVDCGYRPRTINDGQYLPSTLQWAARVGADRYRMFYVVDAATEKESHIVDLTSVEAGDVGAPGQGSELERACALEQACGAATTTINQCVSAWLIPSESTQAAYARFVAARTCDEVRAADPAAFVWGQSCATDGIECRAGLAVACGGGQVSSVLVDCGKSGGVCSIVGSGVNVAPSCATGIDCTASAGACDASGRAVMCTNLPITDCAAVGTRCAVNGSGFPTCGAPFPACTYRAQTVCDGTRIVNCADQGVGTVVQDCARAGLSCAVVDGYAGCTDGQGACDVYFNSRCDGSKLVYCLQTSLRTVDCAAFGMSCGDDGVRSRCLDGAARPDLAPPPVDLGAPACGSVALGGATVPETEVVNYPTATGGTIADGTYHLTKYELWSQSAQPYTHRETLVFAGGMLTRVAWHSAIGLQSWTGSVTTTSPNLTFDASCPSVMSFGWRYSVNGNELVILDSSQIRTYTRQ